MREADRQNSNAPPHAHDSVCPVIGHNSRR